MKTTTETLKEYELNREFTFAGKRLKVVKAGENGCNSCFLEPHCARGLNRSSYNQYHLYCMANHRTDKESVKFISCQGQK